MTDKIGMLDAIDFNVAKISKEEYKPEHDELVNRLVVLQQKAKEKGVGMVVLFEGWNGSGKGCRISDLVYQLDARSTSVYLTKDNDFDDTNAFVKEGYETTGFYPFMQDFWGALGMRGEMTLFDCGWYSAALQEVYYRTPKKKGKKRLEIDFDQLSDEVTVPYINSVEAFERQLVDDGYIVLKFFVHIPQKTQKKRLMALANNPKTKWRVDEREIATLDRYEEKKALFNRVLPRTNFDFAPWVILNGEDKRRANLTIARTIVTALDEALNKGEDPAVAEAAAKAKANSAGNANQVVTDERSRTIEEQIQVRQQNEAAAAAQAACAPKESRFEIQKTRPTLQGVDYHLRYDEEMYRKELKRLQKRFSELEIEMYLKRIPFIIMYEGWDAAGKGGNIKRVARALDARSYSIFTSPAPTRPELMHPHLWRYWTRLPRAGHVGIYDRSWYGRVLVERVEGFASPEQWSRAYDEINEFELDLHNWGAIILKFWVDIDRDEQLARFIAREENPDKQYKITDEDWRNRDKYPQYKAAVEDMFRLTSTDWAPWILLESNDKRYARIKALRIIVNALEERLYGETTHE